MMLTKPTEAGILLTRKLQDIPLDNAIVVAIPKGGVIIGNEIANTLSVPLDIVLHQEIGHELNINLPVGYVGLNSRVILWASNISLEYLEEETQRIQEKLRVSYFKLTGRKEPYSLFGKTVILADDFILGSSNILKAIRLIQKNNPLRIIIATPFITAKCLDTLSKQIREIIYVNRVKSSRNESQLCMNFADVQEEEIIHFFHDPVH
jgi:putative phosphoribosyl transferase